MCICHIADKLSLHGRHGRLSCNSAAHKFRPLVRFAHNVVWHYQPILLFLAPTSTDYPRSSLAQSRAAGHWSDLFIHRTGPRLSSVGSVQRQDLGIVRDCDCAGACRREHPALRENPRCPQLSRCAADRATLARVHLVRQQRTANFTFAVVVGVR